MMGWRARLGFLVPPGHPTVEPEMMQLAPPGVSLHCSRLVVDFVNPLQVAPTDAYVANMG
jgi:maleate cis-trans isomerase